MIALSSWRGLDLLLMRLSRQTDRYVTELMPQRTRVGPEGQCYGQVGWATLSRATWDDTRAMRLSERHRLVIFFQ